MKGLLRARPRVEYDFYRVTDSMLGFSSTWTVGSVFVQWGSGDELFLNF